jgi:N-acetyl-gamma-glutamyl-phosphate reductase
MKKIFIDGKAGTTGLRIYERLSVRQDIEIILLSDDERKDPAARKKALNSCDIAFLCLPDDAARESVSMIENDDVIVIDTSTAHRTLEGWCYGFPELSDEFAQKLKKSKRIAVPGCHASGFIALVKPLVDAGFISKDELLTCHSITGYSGGGKKMIADYESGDREELLDAPRQYALTQNHKHLKEMKAITGLTREPLFSPIVADYYSGMLVSIPFYADMLNGKHTPESIHKYFEEYYKDEKFISVMPFGTEAEYSGFLASNGCSGWDGMEIYVTGNEDRILVSARFDNLGKGASGAAIQCLNVMLGCDEAKGLNL